MQELRESGIDVLGDIPWGSHYSYFYQTTHDLLGTLVPYFRAGLRSNEFCLWIVSNSELLTVEEAEDGLRQAMPDLDRYLAEGSIEIVRHDDWFLNGKDFDLQRVANRFKEKLDEALARGYAGMRVNGSPAWLQKENRMQFCEFEEELNRLFPNERIIASCTFPLTMITGEEIFEITQRHQFAIAKRYGEWEVIETPELKQAKSKINRLNEDLEQRIVERTRQLSKAIGELKIAYQRLSYHVENTPLAVIEFDKDLFVKRWSQRAEEIFGWKGSEAIGKNMYDADFPIIYEDDIPAVNIIAEQLMKGIFDRNLSLNRNNTKNGNVIYCEWYNSVLRDAQGNAITILSLVHNVTERKIAEEQIKQSEAHLAEAQQLAKMGSWDFDIKSGRLTWSEELYNVFNTDKQSFVETHGSFLHLVDEEDREFALQTSRHTQQTGEPFTIEYHITTSKGEKRVIQEHGYGQVDDNGKVVRLFGTAQDITERKKAEESLHQSYQEIRRLTEHLQNIREEERKYIAREIHDELGQQLTAIKMDVAWIDKKTPEETTDIKRKLKNITALLDGSNQSIRRILSELRLGILDEHGLLEAIEWLGRQLTETTGILVKFTTPEKDIKVPEQIATCIFRVCQEAFTNITRYAFAKNVSISIKIIEENIILIIEDDGTGFDVPSVQTKKSFGILGMKERVLSLNGKFELVSSLGKGTKIIVSLPYKIE